MIGITVVRRREYSKCERRIALRKLIFVAFLGDLMPSYDETQLIVSQKRLALGSTIKITAVSQLIIHKVIRPAIAGVTPQQITHGLVLIDLLKAIDPLDLI